MSKISIIIPVYNAADTIQDTLDSILNQTYKNIEIICVDDGSKDSSLTILQNYAQTHSGLIKILHQENQGVSTARNVGIDNATGKILMFVDADDSLKPHACEYIVQIFKETQAEVFTFGFQCVPEKATPLGMGKELKPPRRTYNQFLPDLLFKDKSRPYICRTAVSSKLIHRERIRFEPEVNLGEDQIIYFLLYPLSKKTILLPDQLYYYNMRDESATHENASNPKGSIKKIEQHMKVVEAILREWKERNLSQICRAELLEWILDFVLFDISSLDQSAKYKYLKRLANNIEQYYGSLLPSINLHFPTKICLRDIIKALDSYNASRISRPKKQDIKILHLALFYLMRYGFVRCAQQILINMGLLKKWR